jgi:hypothetical protein
MYDDYGNQREEVYIQQLQILTVLTTKYFLSLIEDCGVNTLIAVVRKFKFVIQL